MSLISNKVVPIGKTDSAHRLSTRLAFLAAGLVVSAWAPLVPYAKDRLGLDEAALGLLLLCLGGGSLCAMPVQIYILHKEENQVLNSKINQAITLSNKLLKIAAKPIQNIQAHQADILLLRKAGVHIPKLTDLTQFFKSREFCSQVREKAL